MTIRGGGAAVPDDDPRWAAGKALFAASLADQDLLRDYLSVAMLLSRAEPSRRELLAGISG